MDADRHVTAGTLVGSPKTIPLTSEASVFSLSLIVMLTKQLADILQGIQSPGDFYSSGSLEIFPPCLEVNRVGRISLPLLPVQAEQLVKVADRAPYGKGYETLVDTEVRRTWQIDASQVRLSGKYWQKNLADIVNHVKLGLGVNCAVSAELYKLLVYDTGSFFTSHRDTEKADGMFATLIIVLPSDYSGGELLVRHQQEEVKLDLRSQEPEEISFAAFYADCVHEVLPVTDGCRLTLVYNLIRIDNKTPLPTPPDYRQAQQKVAVLLNNWVQSLNTKTDEDDTPKKLIYLLEHEYSIAELKFDALKNMDAASADVLISAAEQADCDLYLALVSIEESGSAEHIGGGYYNRWGNDDDEEAFEIGEVFDHSETISEWRCPDGSQPALPPLPFEAEEFCPPGAFDSMEPDDIEFQEATGNAGASFERMYHCAALVLWPRARYLAIINQAGLAAALSVLNDLCRQWGNDKNEGTKQDAQTLAAFILRDWLPQHCAQSNGYGRSDHTPDFLNCMCRLGNIDLINRVWLIIAEKGIYKKQDSLALAEASGLLPWSDVVDYATDAITVSAAKAQEACIALLSCLCSKREQGDDRLQQLSAAAQTLFENLPGDSKRFPELQPWQQQRLALTASDVADIVVSFSMINSDIAEKTLDYIIAWPTMYGVDKVLLPAAIQIVASTAIDEFSAVERLRQLVITHLQTRLAEQLEPPADWNRDNTNKCSCKDCSELNQFLISADQAQWRFKAAEPRRKHVQHAIDMNKIDVDYVTEKKNRPYSLICTKNQASYQRRVEQSKRDQDALARLHIYVN